MAATAYCGTSDLDRYYENFVLFGYGTYSAAGGDFPSGTVFGTAVQDDMNFAFDEINDELYSIGKIKQIPVGTQANGKYPSSMIKWNSYLTIYNKLKARHISEHDEDELPAYVQHYKDECVAIRNGIITGDIVFEEDVSISESGIGKPEIIDWSGHGTGWLPISNWNTGDVYQKAGEDIHYYFKSTAAANLTTATCATFAVRKGSPDVQPFGTYTLGIDGGFTNIEYGLKARIKIDQPRYVDGTMLSAIEGTVTSGAEFRVRCVAPNIMSYGDSHYIKSFRLDRG